MSRIAAPVAKRSSHYDRYVGTRLRAARMAHGLSQSALGESLGVTFQQVQKYERGTNRVSAGRLFEIALQLDIDVGYFFEGLRKDGARTPMEDEATALFGAISRIGNKDVRKLLVQLITALAST